MKGKGGWTGRTWRYSRKYEKDAIHYQWRETRDKPAFTFTAAQEKDIRSTFPRGFPDHGKSAFLRRMAGALAKLESDKREPARPRAARKQAIDRAEKLANLLSNAAGEIGKIMKTEAELLAELRAKNGKVTEVASKRIAELAKMYETERDFFDLAVSGNPVALTDVVETLEKSATGFRKAADGHAVGRGNTVARSNAVALFVAAQAAAAWRETFGREPSPKPKSPFAAVLDKLLDILGGEKVPRLGEEAIGTAIKGPPKGLKSR